ncbi:MAG: hypothetical protein LC113_13740 [Acidobacteria bacterium]|nr:hypothetical protein [Acidobacteriota bacterium]
MNDGTANTAFISKQTEPLGQTVALEAPPDPQQPPPTYNEHLFDAADPTWQCSLPFSFQPVSCAIRAEIASAEVDFGMHSLWDPDKIPGDPNFIAFDYEESLDPVAMSRPILYSMLKGTVKIREIHYGGGFKAEPDSGYPLEIAMQYYLYLRDGIHLDPDFDELLTSCANSVADYLKDYAKNDGSGSVDPFKSVLEILGYAAANEYNAAQSAFSIANGIQETFWFSQLREPITRTCETYEGGCAFRGAGYTHLTHLSNYRAVGFSLGVGEFFVDNPDLITTDSWPVVTMGAFFELHGILDILSDGNDYLAARKRVNPGENLNKAIKGARVSRSLGDRLVTIAKRVESIVGECGIVSR